jgi:hypothetical protein
VERRRLIVDDALQARDHPHVFAVGRNAIATPVGVRVSGLVAKLAGRAYHLLALPSGRLRVLSHAA